MIENIYQVVNDDDLSNIINEKKNMLTVAMLIDTFIFDQNLSRKLKLTFYEISQKNHDVFFIYIDLRQFTETKHLLSKDIKIPRFIFYYNSDEIGYVEGMDIDVFVDTLNKTVSKVRAITQPQIAPQNSEKLETLNESNDVESNDSDELLSDDLKSLLEMQQALKLTGKPVDLQVLIKTHLQTKKNKELEQKKEQEYNAEKQLKLLELQKLNNMAQLMQARQYNNLMELKKYKENRENNS